jgi:predicted SPOUT superfamily RNA methylase MTH1
MCEVGLEDLKKQAPGVLRDNYQSKFAHPLLNTLQLNSSRSGRPPMASGQCMKCFQDLAQTLPHNEQDQFLQISSKGGQAPTSQDTYQPEETGWKIYYGGPDWDSGVLRGVCNADEMTGLEECLNFFWTCDANRVRLEKWVLYTNSETKYIDTHPGTRPGVY